MCACDREHLYVRETDGRINRVECVFVRERVERETERQGISEGTKHQSNPNEDKRFSR